MARHARIPVQFVGLLIASLLTCALVSVPVTITFQLEGSPVRTVSGDTLSPSPYITVDSGFGTVRIHLEKIGRIDWSPSQQKHIITFNDGRSPEAVTIYPGTRFRVQTPNFEFQIIPAALRTLVLNTTLPTPPSPQPPVTTGTVTVSAMVAGQIQTFDPWTSGVVAVNDWAKPIYRAWFDTNGNPDDGAWGNGQGPLPGRAPWNPLPLTGAEVQTIPWSMMVATAESSRPSR